MEGRTRVISRTGGGAALRALLALVLAIGLMPAIPATALADEPTAPAVDSQQIVATAEVSEGVATYASLADAVNNVMDRGTVTLMGDFSGDGVIVESGKNFTLDLGGHTYTIDGNTVESTGTETNGFQLLKDSTITIKNGTIKSDNAKILIQNYSNLTLEKVDLVGGTNTQYTLSNNNGEILIGTGTNIEAGSASPQVAFDVCRYASYPSVKVTVAPDAGKISGKIELSASNNEVMDGFSLSIKGGDLSGASLKIAGGGNLAFVEKSPNVELAAPYGSAWINGRLVEENPGDTQQTVVAKIGDVGYTTLSAAIAAASNSGTVVLQSNVNESVSIEKSATVTIDLNGHTLTNVKDHTITNNGTLTIVDSSENGAGTVDCVTHGKGALVNYGTVTVKGGTFTRSKEASTSPTNSGGNSWYVIDNQGEMTFNGGKVVNKSEFSSLVRNLNGSLTINGGEFENAFIALKNDEKGKLVVNGGTVTSSEQSLQNWNEATLSGGTFNGRVATWGYTGTDVGGDNTAIGKTTIAGSAVVNGDVQAINYKDSENLPVVTVSGGTVNGYISKAKHDGGSTQKVKPNDETSTIVVTGGNFKKTEPNGEALLYFMGEDVVAKSEDGSYVAMERKNLEAGDYIVPEGTDGISDKDLAPGFEVVKNEDGTFTVVEPSTPVTPPAKPSYDVAVDQPANGTVELSAKTAKEGQKVIVTVKPDEGFELASLVVADEDGNALKLELSADGTYSFEMPAGDVTVHAAFECDGGELCPSHGFTDVDQSQWYHAAIDWAVDNDVLQGVGDGLMLPDGDITRAQMAQVLWNVEGQPAASEGAGFSDVSDGDWFAGAVAWASQEGIFVGYDGAFDPGSELTREQAAAALMRWAESNGDDVSGRADLSGFPDADGISEWAVESVRWAVDAGVLQGVANPDGTTTVSAQGTATRAQVAALMMRLEGQRTA